MFTFSEMLALVESESSFGAYVCHRRPGGSLAISDLVKVFADLGLMITIQTNLKVADFLDLSLNLSTESLTRLNFRKPNDQPLYIHDQSNHPPNIIRNLSASISYRLTDISSNKDVFANAKPLYDKALRESGFGVETEYLERQKEQGRVNRKTRS